MISIKIRSVLVGGNQGGHSSLICGADLAVTAWLMSGGMSSWKSKDGWLFFLRLLSLGPFPGWTQGGQYSGFRLSKQPFLSSAFLRAVAWPEIDRELPLNFVICGSDATDWNHES